VLLLLTIGVVDTILEELELELDEEVTVGITTLDEEVVEATAGTTTGMELELIGDATGVVVVTTGAGSGNDSIGKGSEALEGWAGEAEQHPLIHNYKRMQSSSSRVTGELGSTVTVGWEASPVKAGEKRASSRPARC
jgi:hypothetical protein